MENHAGLERIIHIIPLGHEIDRAVVPFQQQKPNRVYILAVIDDRKLNQEMVARQRYFVDQVTSKFDKDIEVKIVNTNMFNLQEVIKKISHIIDQEKKVGNRVFVNMSACGRLTSVGAVVAAMAHNVNLYYVMADDYAKTEDEIKVHGLSICRTSNVNKIINFNFVLPDPLGMEILVFLYRKNKPVRTVDLLDFLKDKKEPGFQTLFFEVEDNKKRTVQSRQLMKLDKTILQKLEKDKLIIREKSGRNVFVSLNESGRYVACLSGLLD